MNVLSETCSNTSQDASKTHQTCVYLLFIIMLVGEFKKTAKLRVIQTINIDVIQK